MRRRVVPFKAVAGFLLGALLVPLLPVSPAAAASGAWADPTNDVLVYSWSADRHYANSDWEWVDITNFGFGSDQGNLVMTTKVRNLKPGYWTISSYEIDVNGDGNADFETYLFDDGHLELDRSSDGATLNCAGMQHAIMYHQHSISTSVPLGCIGNPGSVAIRAFMFDAWSSTGSNCCYSSALDIAPNSGFSPRVSMVSSSTSPTPDGYDPNGPTGTIYRLYRAYFLREPDKAGYDYWLGVYRNGYPLTDISQNFSRSHEFQSRYGTLDNPQFIRRVYLNVLGREPDPAGYNYWAHQMHNGMPRGVVMINFSDSAEFRSKTASGRPPGY